MKKHIYAILLLMITLSFGCKTNDSNLSLRVEDTETTFIYDAVYPVSKTAKLEEYIAKELSNKLPMNQKVDATVNLVSGELIKVKATRGVLNIKFDKRNSAVTGYIKIKKFTDGISKVLSEK